MVQNEVKKIGLTFKPVTIAEWTARGNKYYVISTEKVDGQFTAQTECQTLNANLLSIEDQEELDFVTERIS